MDDMRCGKATRKDIADGMRRHYRDISTQAQSWMNTIDKAIDAWEREPTLTAQLAQAKEDLESEKLMFKSLTEHVEVHEGELKEDLAAITLHRDQLAEEVVMVLRPRVGEAKAWLRQFNTCLSLQEMVKLLRGVYKFLNTMAEAEAEPTPPSKSIQRRVAIQSGGECVVVRRKQIINLRITIMRLLQRHKDDKIDWDTLEEAVEYELKDALTQGREGE